MWQPTIPRSFLSFPRNAFSLISNGTFIHSFPTYKFVILFFLVLFLLFLFPFFLSFKDLYIYYIISSTWSRKFFRASFILIFSSLSVIGLFDTFPDPGFLPVRYLRTVLDLRALHAPFSKGRTNNPFPRMIWGLSAWAFCYIGRGNYFKMNTGNSRRLICLSITLLRFLSFIRTQHLYNPPPSPFMSKIYYIESLLTRRI